MYSFSRIALLKTRPENEAVFNNPKHKNGHIKDLWCNIRSKFSAESVMRLSQNVQELVVIRICNVESL